jgi:hypothetical protein
MGDFRIKSEAGNPLFLFNFIDICKARESDEKENSIISINVYRTAYPCPSAGEGV